MVNHGTKFFYLKYYPLKVIIHFNLCHYHALKLKIVSNHRNGIDVDKFDYFKRDALNLGVKSSFQTDRYIVSTRIMNEKRNALPQICLKKSVRLSVVFLLFSFIIFISLF